MKKVVDKLITDKTRYLIGLVITVVLMVIFFRSYYWPTSGFSYYKLLEVLLIGAYLLVLPVVIMKCRFLFGFANTLLSYVKENRKRVILSAGLYLVSLPLAWGAAWLISLLFFAGIYNPLAFWLCLAVFILTVTLIVYHKPLTEKVELLFVVAACVVGVTYIQISPALVGVSWDDEIHYRRTISVANAFNNVMYDADAKNIDEYAYRILEHPIYDRQSQTAYMAELESMYENQQVQDYSPHEYGYYTIAYMIPAIGILIGRGLGLGYAGVFNMGRFFSLLQCVVLLALAIRQLKSGKRLVAALGMIPTFLFLACSYSYDSFTVAFIVLGYCSVIGALQDGEKKITLKTELLSVGAIFVGCLPKAIYFPLLFPLLFLPKDKYENAYGKRRHILMVLAAGILLVASFLLPMLIPHSGALSGDTRGGSDVNAGGQIAFILANPLGYVKILLRFLKDYLSLDNAWGYTGMFAYIGNNTHSALLMITLFVTAFLDRSGTAIPNGGFRISSLVAVIGCVILVPTSMYISFTGVGYDSIAGCQYRYLLPMLFPFLNLIGSEKVSCRINRTVTAYVPVLIMASSFLYSMWQLLVRIY